MAFRSVRVTLDNRITRNDALVLTDATLDHGIWTDEPPGFAGKISDWGSESEGFLTGTEGHATFVIPGEFPSTPRMTLKLHWNNPTIGDNSYSASVRPDGHTHSKGFSVGFFGAKRFDDEAEVTFVLLSGNCSVDEATGEVECHPAPFTWHSAVPSAGETKVAADTSPTSWYTTPENLQHIAYVGIDHQIHEVFFRIGGTRWEHSIPSQGRVPVAPGTSPTSWYTTPENVQHIAYVGIDHQIHEVFFRIGGTRWEHSIPSQGEAVVAPGTSPTSWYTTPENVQHIAYVGIDDGRLQIHECFFRIGGTRWKHSIPSQGEAVVAPGTSPTSWYTTPENVQHIAYVGIDDGRLQIHECFFRIGGTRWKHSTPGAGQLPVAPGTSPTSWYTTPANVQHIAYVGTDGVDVQVHQCFFFVGGFGGWRHEIPSAGDHVKVLPGTSPTSWYTTPENVQHIAYVGTDHEIHECFFFVRVGGNHVWRHTVPSAGDHVKVLPGTSPTSWYTTPENVQHIAYVGTDHQIHECFFFIS